MKIENTSEWKPTINAIYQSVVFGYGGDTFIADEHARDLVRLTIEHPSMRAMLDEQLMFSMVVMEADAKADKAEAKAEAKSVRKRSKKHG